jgi:hypothetical protein
VLEALRAFVRPTGDHNRVVRRTDRHPIDKPFGFRGVTVIVDSGPGSFALAGVVH